MKELSLIEGSFVQDFTTIAYGDDLPLGSLQSHRAAEKHAADQIAECIGLAVHWAKVDAQGLSAVYYFWAQEWKTVAALLGCRIDEMRKLKVVK